MFLKIIELCIVFCCYTEILATQQILLSDLKCTFNQKNERIPPNNHGIEPTLLIGEETKLVRGRLLTTIPRLSTEWIVSFDYKMTEIFLPSEWLNIIHLTIGNDASRTPAVFMNYDTKKLNFHTTVNTESDYPYMHHIDFQLNRSYAIEIHQRYISGGEYRFFVKIDGVQVHSVVNRMATQFYNVKIYASDPWYESNGWISNLKLTNFL